MTSPQKFLPSRDKTVSERFLCPACIKLLNLPPYFGKTDNETLSKHSVQTFPNCINEDRHDILQDLQTIIEKDKKLLCSTCTKLLNIQPSFEERDDETLSEHSISPFPDCINEDRRVCLQDFQNSIDKDDDASCMHNLSSRFIEVEDGFTTFDHTFIQSPKKTYSIMLQCATCNEPMQLHAASEERGDQTLSELSIPHFYDSHFQHGHGFVQDKESIDDFVSSKRIPSFSVSETVNEFMLIDYDASSKDFVSFHQQQINAVLLNTISDESEGDHPLCEKCICELGIQMNTQLEIAEHECKDYRSLLEKFETKQKEDDFKKLQNKFVKLKEKFKLCIELCEIEGKEKNVTTSLESCQEKTENHSRKVEHRIEGNEDGLEKEHNELEKEHNALEKEHNALEKEHNELEKEHNALEKEHNELEKEHNELEKEHNALEKEHNELEKEHNELEKEHNALEKEHNALEKVYEEVIQLQNELEKLKNEASVSFFELHYKEVIQLQNELENLKNEVSTSLIELQTELCETEVEEKNVTESKHHCEEEKKDDDSRKIKHRMDGNKGDGFKKLQNEFLKLTEKFKRIELCKVEGKEKNVTTSLESCQEKTEDHSRKVEHRIEGNEDGLEKEHDALEKVYGEVIQLQNELEYLKNEVSTSLIEFQTELCEIEVEEKNVTESKHHCEEEKMDDDSRKIKHRMDGNKEDGFKKLKNEFLKLIQKFKRIELCEVEGNEKNVPTSLVSCQEKKADELEKQENEFDNEQNELKMQQNELEKQQDKLEKKRNEIELLKKEALISSIKPQNKLCDYKNMSETNRYYEEGKEDDDPRKIKQRKDRNRKDNLKIWKNIIEKFEVKEKPRCELREIEVKEKNVPTTLKSCQENKDYSSKVKYIIEGKNADELEKQQNELKKQEVKLEIVNEESIQLQNELKFKNEASTSFIEHQTKLNEIGVEDKHVSESKQYFEEKKDDDSSKIKHKIDGSMEDDLDCLQNELQMLKEEEIKLKSMLCEREVKMKNVTDSLKSCEEENEKLQREELRFLHEYHRLQRQLLLQEDDQHDVDNQIHHAEALLDKFKKTNIFDVTFHIWHDGHFGIINNFRLGRLPTTPVPWEEINSAWGQTALLLHSLARKANFTFERYILVPYGDNSYLKSLDDETKELPLYCSGGFKYQFDSNYDHAMVAFLDCVQQFKEKAAHRDPDFSFPYEIDHYKIKDTATVNTYSIKIQFNSMEQWTKALKFMLTNLKWVLAWVIAHFVNS